MPEQKLTVAYKRIKKEWKLVFATAFLSGLITYAYRFLNMLPNWDTLMDYYYPTNNMIHQGRHLQIIGCMFSSFYDIPWITGLLSLLYLAVSVILVIEILQLHDKIGIVMISLLMTVFPTVISSFAFMYMADAFHSAMLFAVLAVWTSLRYRHGWILGGMCLCMSAGIYQAYIPFAIGLIIVWLADQLIFTKNNPIRQIGRFLLMGIWGILLYVVSLQVLVHVEGAVVGNHQGMGSMGIPDLQQIITGVLQSYIDTLYFFTGSLRKLSLYQVGNVVLFLCAAVAAVTYIIRSRCYRQWGRLILACLCMAALPCVAHLFYFLTGEVWYHALMQGTLWLCYVLVFLILERTGAFQKKISMGCIMGALLAGYACILAANTAYLKMNTSYEKTMAMLNRVVDRMEQLPEYGQASQLAVIGEVKDSHTSQLELNPTIVGVTDGYFVTHQEHMVAALAMYYDIELQGVEEKELEALCEKAEIVAMPEWPAQGSVCQVGDTIVVKFSEPEADASDRLGEEDG